jgi:DNA-binding NarL/FixJ family response regulator
MTEPTETSAVASRSRILIVDDHPLVREGLAVRIAAQPDLEICGESATAAEALALIQEQQPDLVIVDILLADGNGIDLIKDIRVRHPQVKLLVITAFDESLYGERAIRAGAHGFVNKQTLQSTVIDAVRTVLSGKRFMSDELAAKTLSKSRGTEDDPIQRLSDRELQVFGMIGRGISTVDIAKQLHLSPHTIESHREKLRLKLRLKNGTELMQRAVQWVLENG